MLAFSCFCHLNNVRPTFSRNSSSKEFSQLDKVVGFISFLLQQLFIDSSIHIFSLSEAFLSRREEDNKIVYFFILQFIK